MTMTTTATIRYWPMDCIEANPWQPRAEQDDAKVASIAASIKANREGDPSDPQRGLLQVPLARPHPDPAKAGWVQLQFGHTRQAALLTLGDADMPLVIRDATDRQMADRAAQENVERKDLSAIEIARAIQRYISDFSVTQAEAGRVYGYSSQSSVSNLLRLLELPDAVQQHVQAGELPERYARELVKLGRVAPAAAAKVATVAVNAAGAGDDDEAKHRFRVALDTAYDKQGVRFGDEAAWDLAWPGKPIPVANPAKGEPAEIVACKACPFFVDGGSAYYRRCLNPACMKLKMKIFEQHALESASQKLGIPIASKEELGKAIVAYNGQGSLLLSHEVVKAIKAKDATLRLALFEGRKGGYDYSKREREQLLGYSVLMLVTTNAAELRRKFAALKEKKAETSYEREERQKRERRKRNVALVKQAAPLFAPALPVKGQLLAMLHERLEYMSANDKQKWAAAGDDARRAEVVRMLLESSTKAGELYGAPAYEKVRGHLDDLARTLGVRLPHGWADADMPAPAPKAKVKAKPAKRGGK